MLRRRYDCNCDPSANHRWDCPRTPIWAQTMRDLDANPWTVMNDYPRCWLDWNWVWRYGHLCQGCGNPRYEGGHGMSGIAGVQGCV